MTGAVAGAVAETGVGAGTGTGTGAGTGAGTGTGIGAETAAGAEAGPEGAPTTAGLVDYNHHCRTSAQDHIAGVLHSLLGDTHYRCLPSHQRLLREQIALAGLDFLVFADLGMDFSTYALAHSRLARFQVSGVE